jgi:hypothetical protein
MFANGRCRLGRRHAPNNVYWPSRAELVGRRRVSWRDGWGLVGQALLGNFDFYGMYTVDRLVTSVLFTSFVVVCWYR